MKKPDARGARRERNLRRRETRRERWVESWSDHAFCGVCQYHAHHCRCAGVRLFLRDEVLRLQALLSPRQRSRGKALKRH